MDGGSYSLCVVGWRGRSFFFLSWKCCGCPLFQYVLTFNCVLNKVRTINQNLNLNTLSLPYHLITAAIFSSLPLWPIFGVFLGFFVQEEKKKKVVASN